ncbi:MAG TPA: hypothetical protein VM658_17275 [bacterium]|nr:hypothetical protein [bacterium]
MPDAREKILILTTALDRACRSLGFRDYMPDPMIGHFVKQVVPVSFKDDRLDTSQFYQWVRQEYSVPDHVFSRVFSRMIEEAAEIGVKVELPRGFDPSFDEVIKEYLRYDHAMDGPGPGSGGSAPEEGGHDAGGGPSLPGARPRLGPGRDLNLEDADERIMSELADPYAPEEVAPAAPAWLADAVPPGRDISMEEIRRHVEERIKDEVENDLRARLWPVVCEEVREQLHSELRPEVAAQIRSELQGEVEEDLRAVLEARMREELYPAIHEKVAAEITAVERDRIRRTLEQSCRDEVREELRKELWDEVREEVKQDLRTMLTPVLEEELRKELGGAAGEQVPEGGMSSEPRAAAAPAPPAAPGISAQVQLEIIKKIRSELEPRIRASLAADLEALARLKEQRERESRLEARLADTDYCLEKIRAFLFADQPALWNKVKPFIIPEQWNVIVRFLETGGPEIDAEKIERTRGVIRDALIIKAEIEEEINYTPAIKGIEAARQGARSIHKTLTGAEQVLDFALQSIVSMLNQSAP